MVKNSLKLNKKRNLVQLFNDTTQIISIIYRAKENGRKLKRPCLKILFKSRFNKVVPFLQTHEFSSSGASLRQGSMSSISGANFVARSSVLPMGSHNFRWQTINNKNKQTKITLKRERDRIIYEKRVVFLIRKRK